MDIEELPREECLRLLQTESYVGRVGFIAEGRPMVLPVNYLTEEGSIVCCTAPSSARSQVARRLPSRSTRAARGELSAYEWQVRVSSAVSTAHERGRPSTQRARARS